MFLKGQSHEIFDLCFFRQIVPVGPLIHGLKRVCIAYRFEFAEKFDSIRRRKSKRITPPIWIYIQTTLAHESGDPGVPFKEKNRGSKISWDCPFNNVWHMRHVMQ
jgi:hypothetical protein